MLLERQRRLLALIDALGGSARNLDFQKLLFLYCKEVEKTPSYDFVPYRFGGFSFTCYADKRRLIEQGFLMAEEKWWRLTPSGCAAARVPHETRAQMDDFAYKWRGQRGDALVAETYRRHPYYAIRSEIADQLLVADGGALQAIEFARPATERPALFTIGYEGRTLESFLNLLLQSSITLLCDTRRNPLSRKYGFSKATLTNACHGVGIRYEHLPQLGIASDERRDLRTQADYDALFRVYVRETLPHERPTLAMIQGWVASGERVALMCFERYPQQCHRHCVADALERRDKKSLIPRHL